MKRTQSMICKPSPESDSLVNGICFHLVYYWGRLDQNVYNVLNDKRNKGTYTRSIAIEQFYKFVNYCIKRANYENLENHLNNNYSTQAKFTAACHFTNVYEETQIGRKWSQKDIKEINRF